MSIAVKRIIKHIRLQINDFDEAKVSSFQILNFLNRALAAISTAVETQHLNFLAKSQVYTGTSAVNGAVLPEDFQSVNEVVDGQEFTLSPAYVTKTPKAYEYKIMGEKIYCGADSYTLFYQRFIPPVDTPEDTIEAPLYCLGLIVQTTIKLMQGMEAADLVKMIQNMVVSDIPADTYDKKRKREG
ncbi:MAG: hypothetical protein IJ601_04330 [Acidaminococcaceae bacterium]|nr:hypothetical protein [Acidaminococcaceae bacterium]